MNSTSINLFLEGFFLQASLILALGAQNIFVIESGLKQRRHIYVAFVSSLCDALLIIIGVAGAATLFVKIPFLKIAFGILGVVFLFYYGLKKLQEGVKPPESSTHEIEVENSFKKITLLTLSFSLLNPHVYLDTLILIGGYSSKFPSLSDRMLFGGGAAALSVIWFFLLAIGASSLNFLLKNPNSMRMIAMISAVILLGLSVSLGSEVYRWIVRY